MADRSEQRTSRESESSEFDVKFTPPPVGATRQLVPIAGPGTCRIEGDSLTMEAYGLKSGRTAMFLGLLVVLAGVFAGGMIGLNLKPESFLLEVAMYGGFAVVAGSVIRNVMPEPHNEEERAQFTIHRGNIDESTINDDGEIVLKLSDLKDPSLDGSHEVHLEPTSRDAETRERLREWVDGA